MAALAVSRFVTSTTKLIGVPTYLISTTYARQSFSRGLAAQCRPAADVRPPIRILVAIHTGVGNAVDVGKPATLSSSAGKQCP